MLNKVGAGRVLTEFVMLRNGAGRAIPSRFVERFDPGGFAMAIATTLSECLERAGSDYDVLRHAYTHFSMETAQVAHVPGDRLAKTVLLEDWDGYVAAVLPSTCHVHLSSLRRETGRHLRFAREEQLAELFADCELGAIPPVGSAYGMTTVLEETLLRQPEIYFEAGDHQDLIRMRTDAFARLLADADRRHFSRHL